SGFFLAFMPISVFFGRITTSDIIVVTFTLLCYYFYILWQKYDKNKYFGAMILTFVIGGLTDWHIYFIVPVIAIHCFFKSSKTSNTQKRNKMILFLIISSLIPVLFFALAYLTMGKLIFAYMFHSLLRTSGVFLYGMNEPITFSLLSLATLELQRAYSLFTPIVCFLFAIWAISVVFSFSKKKYSSNNDVIIMMLISGLLDIFTFKEMAYSHNFLLLPFSFSFAMASALGFEQVIKRMPFLFSKHNYFAQKTKILVCVFFILISFFFILFTINQVGNMHSKDDLRDYQTGLFLNKNTLINQVIIADHETKVINYYSKRNTICGLNDINALNIALKNNPEKYSYIVISPDSPFTNYSLKQHLFLHYKLYDSNNILMFDLTQKSDKNIFNKIYNREQKRKINFNDKIEFTGYDITYQPENKSPIKRYIFGNADRYIAITLYWKIIGQLNETYFSFVHFEGKENSFEEGNTLFYNLYPANEWKVNETIKETYLVEIPNNAKYGNYLIIIGIHDEDNKKLKIMENKGKNNYFANIGNIYIYPK
ncbi:MAG: glycosyltransferase family 39 protein, partial [Candidatus Aenigmarchaeota archaeon]|nr:glycosyltransferase family 39 protein [Candidatus Aenigmarchaeota archaeon]